MNRIGDEDNLQLIDFSEEDDYLIDFPFRDSLEDFRLSGADHHHLLVHLCVCEFCSFCYFHFVFFCFIILFIKYESISR